MLQIMLNLVEIRMIEVLDQQFNENLTTDDLFGYDNDTLSLIIQSEGDMIRTNKKQFKIFLGKMASLALIQNQTDALGQWINSVKDTIEEIPAGFFSMWHNLKIFVYVIAFTVLIFVIIRMMSLSKHCVKLTQKTSKAEHSDLLNSDV